ncbi:substrate-binding domain-containing protein [Pseudoalteromonas prydzensis]|uniref:substrate-binding domain-containing protein n=1 Tax=Pseudoalteromonas prydzensis TaxID=182141 RepID=UPI0009FED8E7|nr:substrate-binding domain-containing protein [Pseudoalteromonas prydzensis]
MQIMYRNFLIVASLFTASWSAVCEELPQRTPILIAGSTSVIHMLEPLKARFNQQSTTIMQLRGMGSDQGIKAIGENLVDIGAASRYLTKSEQQQWPYLKQIVLAQDGMVFFTNTANPITNISTQQLTHIYSGKYILWSQINDDIEPKSTLDDQIQLFSKGVKHGTFDVFLEFLKLDYINEPGTDTVKFKVAGNRGLFLQQDVYMYDEFNQALGIVQRFPNAIAYDSFGAITQFTDKNSIDKIRILSVDGIKATEQTIKSGEYSFVRPLVLIVNTQSTQSLEKAKLLVDFLNTTFSQDLLEKQKYVMLDFDL